MVAEQVSDPGVRNLFQESEVPTRSSGRRWSPSCRARGVWERVPGHAELAQRRVDEDGPGRMTRELSEVSEYAYFCQWGQFSCVDVAERIWIGEKEALPA